ncbi:MULTISPECIES: hypothetical protein [unclassified Streptomyces]|uniref:hypothetical protein n=1 Tax=unclassified Streptomyces TaxID=2593676 RepID=UPI000700EC98|nr:MULTISPECIES: hypothetical protein [unclassified Streptomyces]KQX56925.1 hypothetical protein ASD33_28105 [Streptomyces sp. Root1304]KRA98506.1 hypothetical protein ASE09_24915 [Streptomyces sp. Root66D1]
MNDDEPVFKKSKWGTNRYSLNPRNPVGLGLIIATSVFAILMVVLMENRAGPFEPSPAPTWSPHAYTDGLWHPTPSPS